MQWKLRCEGGIQITEFICACVTITKLKMRNKTRVSRDNGKSVFTS